MQDEQLAALQAENGQLRADYKDMVDRAVDLDRKVNELLKINAAQLQQAVDAELLRIRIRELEVKVARLEKEKP